MSPAFYQASGRVSLTVIPALLGALALTVPVAFAYAWLGARMPWLLGILTIWLFAFCMGCLAKLVGRLGKVRKPSLMKELGLVLALWGWAVQWVVWIVFVSYPSVSSMPGASILIPIADLFADPGAAIGVALSEAGWNEDADADFLMVFSWIGELAILAAATIMAGVTQAGRPFCEASNRWMSSAWLPLRFAAEHIMQARKHLVTRPEQLLAALVPAKSTKRYVLVRLYRGAHDAFVCLDVIEFWWSKKQRTHRRSKLVRYCLVPGHFVDPFMARVSQQAEECSKGEKPALTSRPWMWLGEQIDLSPHGVQGLKNRSSP